MIKRNKGITLVSLVIAIVLMIIISSTAIYSSYESFELNHVKKMLNDLELLEEKVSNYYLKYGVLPILRNSDGTGKEYIYTALDFERNSGDNSKYYILDLEAMYGLSLNYGEKGFKNPNASDDVYIINELTHTIYYVKGTVMDGVTYHYKNINTVIGDNSLPSRPQIIVTGTKSATNEEGIDIYSTDVTVEIIPGKNNVYGVGKTEYSIDGGTTWNTYVEVFQISGNGIYTIKARTYDILDNSNYSEITKIIVIESGESNIS